MRSSGAVKLGLMLAFAAVTALAAGLALAALLRGGVVQFAGARLELAAGYDRRAEALVGAKPPTAAALVEARRLTKRALTQAPYDTGAWLRLAYLDAMERGSLGPTGIAALRRSYELTPYDPAAAFWRIRFGLESWGELSPELRDSVKSEVFVVATSPSYREQLRYTLQHVQNPAGRLVAMLWLGQVVRLKNAAESGSRAPQLATGI